MSACDHPWWRPARWALCAVAVATIVAAQSAPAVAQENARMKPALEAALLAKALKFERGLGERAGRTIDVGLLYRGSVSEAKADFEIMFAAFSEIAQKTILGLPLRFKALPLRAGASVASAIPEEIDVVYLCSGLDSDVPDLATVQTQRSLISLATNEAYVQAGVIVGVIPQQGKPKLVVNLPAAEKAKLSFKSRLLGVAKVIK